MSAHLRTAALLAVAMAFAGCSRIETAPEPVRAVPTMTVSAGTAGGSREFVAELRAHRAGHAGIAAGTRRAARRSLCCA